LKTCENCGCSNLKNAPFCAECGAPLIDAQPFQPKKTVINQTTKLKKNHNSRLPRRHYFIAVYLLIMAAFIIGIYAWGQRHFSKAEQVAALISAIEAQDFHQVSQKISTNEQNFTVTPTTIKPLVNYLHDQPQELKKVANALSKNQRMHGLSIQKKGQKYFFFPHYQFVLTPVYLRVATNQKKVTMKINQTVIGTSNADSYQQEYGPIAPGNYTFEAIIKGPTGNDVRLKETHMIDAETYAPTINLNFKKITIPITSNLGAADIYVNQKKIATYHSGTKIIGPLYWSPGMKIQLRKELNGETITTAEEPIQSTDFSEDASKNLTLQLNFAVLSNYDVRLALEKFYQEFATVSQQPSDATAQQFSAEYLAGGKEHPAYDELWKMIVNQKKLRTSTTAQLQSTYEVTIDELKLLSKNTYQVDYRLQVARASTSAHQDIPQIQWIDGIKERILISKEAFSVSPLQFLTLDERMLNWLSTH